VLLVVLTTLVVPIAVADADRSAGAVIVAPMGFYYQYTKQMKQAEAICRYAHDNPGTWGSAETTGYYELTNAFDDARARLNKLLADKGLGFAPALEDWTENGRFRKRDGSIIRLRCPD
jgi:hypothetical protein